MPKCIILIGAPTSGKSTWAQKQHGVATYDTFIVSRDATRESLYGRGYNYKDVDENLINTLVNRELSVVTDGHKDLIVDNCHLRVAYITDLVKKIPRAYSVEFRLFPISYRKAMIRNIWRWARTGKWIPPVYLNKCIKNYKNLVDYGQYLVYQRHALSS